MKEKKRKEKKSGKKNEKKLTGESSTNRWTAKNIISALKINFSFFARWRDRIEKRLTFQKI